MNISNGVSLSCSQVCRIFVVVGKSQIVILFQFRGYHAYFGGNILKHLSSTSKLNMKFPKTPKKLTQFVPLFLANCKASDHTLLSAKLELALPAVEFASDCPD